MSRSRAVAVVGILAGLAANYWLLEGLLALPHVVVQRREGFDCDLVGRLDLQDASELTVCGGGERHVFRGIGAGDVLRHPCRCEVQVRRFV